MGETFGGKEEMAGEEEAFVIYLSQQHVRSNRGKKEKLDEMPAVRDPRTTVLRMRKEASPSHLGCREDVVSMPGREKTPLSPHGVKAPYRVQEAISRCRSLDQPECHKSKLSTSTSFHNWGTISKSVTLTFLASRGGLFLC